VVPEDEKIIRSSNMGEPIVMSDKAPAGKAYRNIVRRILGENVPLMDLDGDNGFGARLKKLFGGK
jgi:septum site-determining protein MinD